MRFLQKLFEGKIDIAADIKLKGQEKEQEKMLTDIMKKFTESLTPEIAEQFENLIDLQATVQDTYQKEYFLYGYRLAIGLIADGFTNS